MIQVSGFRAAAFAGSLAIFGFTASQGRAQGITFDKGNFFAGAGSSSNTQTGSTTVLGGPNVVSSNDAPNGDAVSTTTATYETSGFSYSFNQSFTDPDGTNGGAAGTFTVTSATSYTITDADPVVTEEGEYDSDQNFTYLEDSSDGDYLYQDLDDDASGSLMGVLTVGDTYKFVGQASLQADSDPALSYDPSIAFGTPGASATPEPSSFLLLGTGVLGVVGAVRRRLA